MLILKQLLTDTELVSKNGGKEQHFDISRGNNEKMTAQDGGLRRAKQM